MKQFSSLIFGGDGIVVGQLWLVCQQIQEKNRM